MIIVKNFWPIYMMTHGNIGGLDFRARMSLMRKGYKNKNKNLETRGEAAQLGGTR